MTRKPQKPTPYQFFLAQAGYSYDPKTETPLQGRQRGANTLAFHEARARDAGASFDWSEDPTIDSREFSNRRPYWTLWRCVARDASGEVFTSLHGIDFGRDGDPWSSPYRRVVEAELACELPDEDNED